MSSIYKNIELPFVRQDNDYFCGPAALQMVFRYFGRNHSQCELARLMGTSPGTGTRKKKMIDAVKENDFHYCKKDGATLEEIEDLIKQKIPTVVYYVEPSENEHHYAVVTGFTDREIILADPWNGKDFFVTKDEFLKRWYGYEDYKKHWLLAVHDKPFCGCSCWG